MNDVLKDELAVEIARALAVANREARRLGVDPTQQQINITGNPTWQISYVPRDQRGGDLLIEVDAGTIMRIVRGQ